MPRLQIAGCYGIRVNFVTDLDFDTVCFFAYILISQLLPGGVASTGFTGTGVLDWANDKVFCFGAMLRGRVKA